MARLSDEQLAITNEVVSGRGNILVIARAGTGKTFVIRKSLPLMRGRIAIAAYNKKIAREIEMKIAEDGLRADIGTFHSHGYRVLRNILPAAKLEGTGSQKAGYYKFDRIAEELEIPQFLHGFAKKAMGLAMQRGFGILTKLNDPKEWLDLVAHYDLDDDIADDNVLVQLRGRDEVIKEGLRYACKAVKRGIEIAHEVVSFDDMLYMPLVLNAKFPQYDWVGIDEAQDSNALRREMAKRMTKPTGRRFWVGDDMQSINGFCGADNDALEIIRREDRCTVLKMTQTFRCAKAVVALAQSIVPDYKAAETNAEGKVETISEAAFYDLAHTLTADDMILCRNTKPLVETAYGLIRKGVACHVEGKEIGKGLLAIIDRWKSIKTLPAMLDKLKDYKERKIAKLMAEKKERQAEDLADKVETIMVMIEGLPDGSTVADLRKQIDDMFADTPEGQKPNRVVLMTIHKSKGLEAKRVFGLGVAKYLPSRFAKQEWQMRQEEHLRYVNYTRAIETYVDVVMH